jgi:hypothetical protein
VDYRAVDGESKHFAAFQKEIVHAERRGAVGKARPAARIKSWLRLVGAWINGEVAAVFASSVPQKGEGIVIR